MDPDGEGIVDEKDAGRLLKARAGDHFMCQFQGDLCHFRNIQRRDPVIRNVKDSLSLRCIRRANLDAMWAREPTTEKSESILLPHSSWSLGVTWPRGASRRASLHRVAKATMLHAASLDGAVC